MPQAQFRITIDSPKAAGLLLFIVRPVEWPVNNGLCKYQIEISKRSISQSKSFKILVMIHVHIIEIYILYTFTDSPYIVVLY